MGAVTYSKLSGKNDATFGKFLHPIKALIENESNSWEKQRAIVDILCNVEKSNKYAETIFGQSDFDTFQSASEGQRAENDSVQLTYNKTIEHIPFMKEFTITKEMADDAKFGMGANMTSKPKSFVRAYYKTRTKLAAWAFIHGDQSNGVFNKAKVDLTCGDKLSLFNKAHTFALEKFKGKTQSNFFYDANLTNNEAEVSRALSVLSNKMRNFKDENNETMDYTPDIIIIPSNQAMLESKIKKVVGTMREAGDNHNDINLNFNNYTIVVLPGWETTDERFILMSSEANKALLGTMFFNRIPLDVSTEVDIHTRNMIWNGYCRFGIGHSTWKHCLMAVNGTAVSSTATNLNLGAITA